MTDSKQPDGDEPKKKSLKLLLRSKPVAEVETSIGRIYLYPLRVRDMTDFESWSLRMPSIRSETSSPALAA